MEHRGHEGLVYSLGLIRWSRSIDGRIPHSIVRMKDERSGPRPFSRASLHDRFQSVSGWDLSHLKGISDLWVGSAS